MNQLLAMKQTIAPENYLNRLADEIERFLQTAGYKVDVSGGCVRSFVITLDTNMKHIDAAGANLLATFLDTKVSFNYFPSGYEIEILKGE